MKKSVFMLLVLFLGGTLRSQNLEIQLSFKEELSKQPLSGRIFLFFNKDTNAQMNTPSIKNPKPTFAMNIKNLKPGEICTMKSNNTVSWMGNLDSLDGYYSVQAVLKTNYNERSMSAIGNLFTDKKVIMIDRHGNKPRIKLLFTILSDRKKKFVETEFIKEIKIDSKIMSVFYNSAEQISAAVILPKGYFKDTTKYYPSVYLFPAWGSNRYSVVDGDYQQKRYGMGKYEIGKEKIFIFVDHECRNGYHEFCDSENNGPREKTFFEEVVPYVEKNYRVDKRSETRFLMGHSSGAWASLWLLINNPDKFGGAFVTSPDPVDFTSFLRENIYKKRTNFYSTSSGTPKYLFEKITMKDFIELEKLFESGEQMYSFDATFSEKGKDGKPERLFNWETGKVNPVTAKRWERYDLSKIVSKLSNKKRASLGNKIHIYVAEDDEFNLNEPVKAFQKVLNKLGISSEILFSKNGGHSKMWTEALTKNIHNQIDAMLKNN